MEQVGTPEQVQDSTADTVQPGSNLVEKVRTLADWNRAWPFIIEAVDKSKESWEYYARRRDIIDILRAHHLYCAPSIEKCEAAALFAVEEFKTGNVEIDVIWSEGIVSDRHILAFTQAANELADETPCPGKKRIHMKACRRISRELLTQEFTPLGISMVKDIVK